MLSIHHTNNGIALAGNDTDTSNAQPQSESNCWCLTVPNGSTATIFATLGADDLASLSVGPLTLALGPRGPYGGGTYSE
ncbi:MAG: hypothetical protein IJB31_05850, partial [Akkermansia sp.]|nr:hypothetical protein [Akkermansia sp.]